MSFSRLTSTVNEFLALEKAMRRSSPWIVFLFVLAVGLVAGDASAAVPGSKLTITFEGLARGHHVGGLPAGYSGFDWGGDIFAAPKGFARRDAGLQSVIHGKVAGLIPDALQSAVIQPVNGLFSMKSGYFAAFHDSELGTTFKAYRSGVLVGTMTVQITQTAMLVQFDASFSKIDELEIYGQVAFDNLKVTFEDAPK
jgi:hypothetical protein